MLTATFQSDLSNNGFAVLAAIFSAEHVDSIIQTLEKAFQSDANGSTLRSADGAVYGARNLLQLCPPVATLWMQSPLPTILSDVLGPRFGLVRVLYFDKPPEQSWALPWHKDMAIAVKDNRLASAQFTHPTTKIGVPHVEAPEWLLEMMLTLRLHLDDMTEENGPLKVLPGSHRGDESGNPVSILGCQGDVLIMRPLLSHCSIRSKDGTTRHRRILHCEFSGVEELPDGYSWHDFVQIDSGTMTGKSTASPIR